ncbi:MAG: hypothetical protein RBS16_03765 [Candidatus Cloacimonadales bacterium]|jgi:hypothetical protein|nr:hypothetical protein [Candidatus Cloacimonadota bacterium]MDD2650071.1 hypothetical protein [Candidatus Cloacimonadota bacterium]MDX9977130.1 hypothetical protein [Candidatus Cloacimonadales bacterium]
MGLKQKKLGIYRILSIVFFLIFVFVLTLPNMFDLNKGQKTEECIKNMKNVVEAAQKYVNDRGLERKFTINELVNGKYLEYSPECPEEGIGDKYNMIIDLEENTVEVKCANEAKHPNHKLPPVDIY